MEIKKFRAASLKDALNRVREELGSGARIVQTQELDESTMLGLVRRRIVEVTAVPEPAPISDSYMDQISCSPYDITLPSPAAQHDYRTEHVESQQRENGVSLAEVPNGSWRKMSIEELNPTVLQQNLIARFQETARFGGPIALEPGRQKVVALVGPTGVGKTSCLVKLAAHYRFKEFKTVGLLSVDMFRVGGTEQLRHYAETLDIPMEAVDDPYRVPDALRRLGPCDLVLFDTPGTSPKNVAKLQHIGASLDAASVDETLLVLSATSGSASLRDARQRFESLGVTGLILTKLDEAAAIRDLYDFLKTDSLPLRFLTTGQSMSDSLEVAGPVRLAALA